MRLLWRYIVDFTSIWKKKVQSFGRNTDSVRKGAKRLRKTLESFCAQGDRAALLAEWDAEKNAPLTPEQLTPGSNKRVWWQCSLGHVWKAVVYSRTGPRPSGCPVCAGKTRPARRTIRQKSNGTAVF